MYTKLINAVADLEEELVLSEVQALKENNVPILDIINSLQEGMSIVGKRFEEKEYFLSELIMSAEIFEEASQLLQSGDGDFESKYGTFLIGTIFDDIHDIGKNIVATIMKSNGFRVVDVGVDASIETYLQAIREHNPKVIGISCLLTTCFDNIRKCIQAIDEAGLREGRKILIGGGPVDEATAKYVGADLVCKNAQLTVDFCKNYMEAQ